MSPIFFNVIVDAVIQKWYTDVMEGVTAKNIGLRGDNVSNCLATLFHTDDGAVGSLDLEWL